MRGGGGESGCGIEIGKCLEQISATVYNENCNIIERAEGSLNISRMERRSRDEILDNPDSVGSEAPERKTQPESSSFCI
jgi:hypothetical protein